MAIDDNTVYGLTGAQVKELPEKINEVRGVTRVLTTDDYNANSSNWSDTDPANFNCVALWKLEPGVYTSNSTNENSVTIAVCNAAIYSQNSAGEKVYIVGKMGNYGRPIMVFYTYSGTEMGRIFQVSNHIGSLAVSISRPVNGLSSTDSSLSLSAAQGKVLNDKIQALGNFSTAEVNTGATWIDGSPIYRKVIGTGGITAGSTNPTQHGISNLSEVISISGTLKTTSGEFYLFPRASSAGSAQNVEVYADGTNIYFRAGSDANFASAIATIYYTKSS